MKFCAGCVLLLGIFLQAPSNTQTATPAADDAIRLLVEQARINPSAGVRGTRLIQPDAVAKFFETRAFAPAWRLPNGAAEMLEAIRDVDQDGLTPDDYHLKTIAAALDGHTKAPSHESAAVLQILIADAAAALIDHVRYGRVRPESLDRRWNVDPRAGAPPLDVSLDQLARSAAIDTGIKALKPNHFIYTGLKQALARMRAIAAAGGWPTVPAGPTLKPGATDPRIALVRKRLAVTGELRPSSTSASAATTTAADETVYDAELEAAVKNFQAHHRLTDEGVIGRATIEAMNVSAEARAAQVRVNLERARWVVGGLRDSFVLVNLPAFKAYVIRDRKNIWETRTQIGREARKTPTFRADMKYLVFNPDWTVPPTILAQDVLAGMKKGQNTIAKKKLTIIDGQGRPVDPSTIDWQTATPRNFRYTLRQPPGEDNALGRVKFIFPNEHSIFLHDTPSHELFAADQRTFSSGCIRVANALDLARVLLEGQPTRPEGWNAERIQQSIEAGHPRTVFLEYPLPVLIVYWTASIGAAGDLRFAKDVYGLDPPLLRALGDR